MSMKPGLTTRPVQSTSRAPLASLGDTFPTAAIRSRSRSRSPVRAGAPVPSTISAPRRIVRMISSFGSVGLRRGEDAGGGLLDPRAFEEPGIETSVEADGVLEGEGPELVGIEMAVLDELPGLAQHALHLRHVPMADVGAEHGSEGG